MRRGQRHRRLCGRSVSRDSSICVHGHGTGQGRGVRRGPRARLDDLSGRHRRGDGQRQAPGRAYPFDGIRPQRRACQSDGLRHRAGGHAAGQQGDRREPLHAEHRDQPLRDPGRQGRSRLQRRGAERRVVHVRRSASGGKRRSSCSWGASRCRKGPSTSSRRPRRCSK